jgi:hypothetical protein
MTMLDMKKAIERYNNLMWGMCREYNTIGTSDTEHIEGDMERNRWTIRDMVAEVDYTLSVYLDPDCVYYQDAHDKYADPNERRENYKTWLSEKNKMIRFIKRYEADALKTHCINNHCSDYDG